MTETGTLKFAVIGTGFWSNYQIAGWQELQGVQLAALYNRTRKRAEQVGEKFGISAVYDNVEQMLDEVKPHFVDIITDVDTHATFAELAAQRGIHVICQKPMAASLEQARRMVDTCRNAGASLFIHENFRWQTPIRTVKQLLDAGEIGKPFKLKIAFCSAFPVFENQPFLATLEQFIITDIGSHVLDVARFLGGEARTLYCLTKRVNPTIKGEDVANVFLEMENGIHCFVEMSYASILEKESFPQTLVSIEGDSGSIRLDHNFIVSVTTRNGTRKINAEPPFYKWADPEYAVVHSSIVDCNRDILQGLNGGKCETTGEDNLKTVNLVWKAYESASTGKLVSVP